MWTSDAHKWKGVFCNCTLCFIVKAVVCLYQKHNIHIWYDFQIYVNSFNHTMQGDNNRISASEIITVWSKKSQVPYLCWKYYLNSGPLYLLQCEIEKARLGSYLGISSATSWTFKNYASCSISAVMHGSSPCLLSKALDLKSCDFQASLQRGLGGSWYWLPYHQRSSEVLLCKLGISSSFVIGTVTSCILVLPTF